MDVVVSVVGLGLWLPGYPNIGAWAERQRDPEALRPGGRSLERAPRRRASSLGRALADTAAEAAADAGVDPATVATIIGSSIGEASTMIGLLEQMWRTRTPMSPAAFTQSVHNAASGLISISNRNHGFTTSLAADHDTPFAALLEAFGLVLTRGCPVVIACGDEAAPEELVPRQQQWDLLAAAVVLAPAIHPRARSRLRLARTAGSPVGPAGLDPGWTRNPQAGLAELADAVRRGAVGSVRLDGNGGRGFFAHIEP